MKTRILTSFLFALSLGFLMTSPCASFAQDAAQADTESGAIGATAIAGILIAGIGMLVSTAAGIWLLVVAFIVHWGWGLACLFLPFAPLVFLVMHWTKSWKPFVANIAGVILLLAGGGLIMTSAPALLEKFVNSGSMEEPAANPEQEAAAMEDIQPVETTIDQGYSPAPSENVVVEPDPETPAADAEAPPLTLETVKIGDPVARLLSSLGRPTGQIQSGGETVMMYGAMTITAREGRVVEVSGAPPASDSPPTKEPKEKPTPKKVADKPKSAPTPKPAASGNVQDVVSIKNGGKRIDMNKLLVPGQVTIVDFYADWCGPCVQMAPHLEAIAKNDPDVVLRKVDIVDWRSDVAQQYQLESIPNVRVFDRSGKQVGEDTSSLELVNDYISKSK